MRRRNSAARANFANLAVQPDAIPNMNAKLFNVAKGGPLRSLRGVFRKIKILKLLSVFNVLAKFKYLQYRLELSVGGSAASKTRAEGDQQGSPLTIALCSASQGASHVFHTEVSPASALLFDAAIANYRAFLGLDDG